MNHLFKLTFALLSLLPVSCQNELTVSVPSNTSENSKKVCSLKNQKECEEFSLLEGCIWNVDRCEDKIKERAPEIPSKLGKVKMLAVGVGFCAIDMKDELWCIPSSALGTPIYPHPSKKYRHVAMSVNGIYDKICATKLDGTSVCFDYYGKEKNGPTKDKVLQTIPAPFKNTVCAFSPSRLYCQSDAKSFEKLDDFSKDPEIIEMIKKNPADPKPELTQIAFLDGTFNPNSFIALFSNKNLAAATENNNKKSLWDNPFIYSDIQSFSAQDKAFCIVDADKGLKCRGGNYHSDTDIPTAVMSEDLVEVATSMDHVCVITKNSRALNCWGGKKLTNPIPKNMQGVLNVAVSSQLTCIIDKDEKVNCFGVE